MKKFFFKKAAVIGLWHLGSTVAAGLAKVGFQVKGLDFDKKLIAGLNKAVLPVAEPGLGELTKKMLKAGRLGFTSDFRELAAYKYIIIAYDTPVGEDDQPNLSVVKKAVGEILKYAPAGSTVIIMSQVPAGFSREIYIQLRKKIKNAEVVYNPENLRLSQAISTYLQADRQIIGISSEAARPRMEKFYSFFKKPLMFMSLESAELVKHGINCFLAMSVSFVNQWADLSEAVGANIIDIVKGIKSDSRIGQKAFLSPGLGFAGGTLGRDLRVLESLGKKYKLALPLISATYRINQGRKQALYGKIKKCFPRLKSKKIALLGLVYKPGTNTLRRSLALEVGKYLLAQGARVAAFDPALKKLGALTGINLASSAYEAARGADAVLIITEWPEFKKLDYKKIKTLMRGNIIFDTKNILSPAELTNLGFNYYGTGIGRKI